MERYQMAVIVKGNQFNSDSLVAVMDTKTSEIRIVKFCNYKDEIVKTFRPFEGE